MVSRRGNTLPAGTHVRLSSASKFFPYLAIIVLGALSMQSCKISKTAQKNKTTTSTAQDSLALADTSKSDLENQFNATKKKVGDFFSSLLPPKQDTGHGAVLQPPPVTGHNPTVGEPIESPPGFLQAPIRKRIEFDSAGNVTEHQTFLGGDVQTPLTYSFQDYLRQREESELVDKFRETMSRERDTAQGESNTGLFGDYSHISIPIPPSIVPTIFGRPSINLRVSGDVAVHLAYRDNQFLSTTGALFSGSETGLDFKQEINVSTSGTVGDKLKIGADWGSDRSFQFENLLKLGYQGFPDEIIQSIEAGNVNLVTPSAYIGTQQALFGLKAVERFGPLYVTELAAQKKGDRQTKTFGGGTGAAATEHVIQPLNYRRNAFFVDDSFRPNYEPYHSRIGGASELLGNNVATSQYDVEVWVSTTNVYDNLKHYAYAWYKLPPHPVGARYPNYYHSTQGKTNDSVTQGYFTRLTDTSRFNFDPYTGVLTLTQEPSDNTQAVAIRYVMRNGDAYGEQSTEGQELILKLVKPLQLFQNPHYAEWDNILKNSYYLGGAGFDEKDFTGRIIFTAPGGNQIEYMRTSNSIEKMISVLGLDRVENSNPGSNTPDGLIDIGGAIPVGSNFIVDRRTGTLTFPYLQPFGQRIVDFNNQQARGNRNYKRDSTFYFPQLYTTSQDALRTQLASSKNNQISINVKFAGGVSTTLNLNAFNLVEGSVKVSIGANVLVENVDYRVDYNSGTITLLKPDLATAGTPTVEYETHDIFTTATKNVLGFRAELPIVDHGLLGFSLMNFSMQLPSLKTRQGEEPLSNWIMGIDGSYTMPAPFITDALNFLPIFNLKEKSSLTAKVDAALSLPNPNTQQSPMAVDNGASIAYLDDFEGGQNQFPLYMNYGRWVHASQPITDDYTALNTNEAIRDSLVNTLKAKTFWYNTFPQDVAIHDIKPNKSTVHANDAAQVLDFVYDPKRVGIYNHYPNKTVPDPNKWGGLMQYAQGLNVQATNTDAIEFWINIAAPLVDPNPVMRFDIGRISEDVIPDKVLETEDKNGNGRYDPGEDVGLDTLSDDQERAFYPTSSNGTVDPNLDDYNFTSGNQVYDNINGTEGNQNDVSSNLRPDTEDLDGNGAVNLDNDYYEYEIPLDPGKNKYIIGRTDGAKGTWYQLHIPLADFTRIVGIQDSSFSNISYFRFWFKGFSQTVHVRMHEIQLVGSQWTKATTGTSTSSITSDTSLKIGYVNIEDNAGAPTNYTAPDGAERDRVPGQTTFILGNEQSLNMMLRCVGRGDSVNSREAYRVFPSPNDIFNYRGLAIWAHGASELPATFLNDHDTINKAWIYIRFGFDNQDYYEYRRPLLGGWQNLNVDFSRLTALKAARGIHSLTASEAANDGIPGSSYTVVGNPTLTNVPIFTLGVQNKTNKDCFSTDVWWDELRLLNANNKPDYAYNASTQLKLAEFGSIQASIVNERPDFHRVDERFNVVRSLNFNWNVIGQFAMQKIFPKWLEAQSVFPLTIAHTETILRPKYLQNTDVEVQGAVQKIQDRVASNQLSAAEGQHIADSIQLGNETLSIKNSIGATGVRFYFPGSFFLLPAFVNQLTYGFGYAEQFTRSPQYEYNRQWSWTATVAYAVPQLPRFEYSPFTWIGTNTYLLGYYSQFKISPLPVNIRFAVSATRGRMHSLDRLSTISLPAGGTYDDTLQALRSRVPIINRVFTATRGMSFSWHPFEGGILSPSFDYALDVTSNLAPLETTPLYNQPGNYYDSIYYFQRTIPNIVGDIFLKDGALVRPGVDFNTSQRVNMNTNPRIFMFGLEKFVRPVFSYNVNYRWQNDQTHLQDEKKAAWNNSISTGLEFNLRDLGMSIFGKPGEAASGPIDRGHREPERNEVGQKPEELPRGGIDDRPGPAPKPRDEPRNQVDRGEDFRPQAKPNPLGKEPFITDTVHGPAQNPVDTTHRIHSRGVGTGGERDQEYVSDTTLIPLAPTDEQPEVAAQPSKPGPTLRELAQTFIQKPLFDWNGTRFNFTQTNQSLNYGLAGDASGITNFLARGIFAPESNQNGPSRAYQLGLITDPEGRLLIRFKPRFPFVGFSVVHGNRATNPTGGSVNLTDVFTQQNNFELSTSRPLWEGATLSLNWKLQFSYDDRNTFRLDSAGGINPLYDTKSGDVSRSFFSLPPLPFSFLGLQSGILRVEQKYAEKVLAAGAPTVDTARVTLPADVHNRIEIQSFMEGFETLPFFSGFLREYLPRLNYSFSWNGLEKFPIFSFADHASLRHAYNGTYRRTYRLNPGDTVELTTLQTIVYGFRPLIALDVSWDKFYGGHLSTSFNYDTQSEWGADYSSTRITKRLSTTIGVTANYQHQGLSIPFLHLNLKNEFGATFTFSETISDDSYFFFWKGGDDQGTGNGGLTKTTIEPRVSYTVSQQLTIEAFYRYERTTPSTNGQISPPTRLITAGFDVRLKIQ